MNLGDARVELRACIDAAEAAALHWDGPAFSAAVADLAALGDRLGPTARGDRHALLAMRADLTAYMQRCQAMAQTLRQALQRLGALPPAGYASTPTRAPGGATAPALVRSIG